MKRSRFIVALAALLAVVVFQGFQCGSPEFTGAKVQINQKNYKEAARLLEIEVQKNPTNEEAWYLLGSIYADSRDYFNMNRCYDQALAINKKHAQEIRGARFNRWGVHLNAAVVAMNNASGDSAQILYGQAVDEFKKAILVWPDTALTYLYLGHAYSNKGESDNALSAYQTAWDRGKEIEAARRMGRIHLQRGVDKRGKFETDNAVPLRDKKNLESIQKGMQKTDVTSKLGAPDNIKKGPKNTKKEEWFYNAFNLQLTLDNNAVASKTFTKPFAPPIDSSAMKEALAEFMQAIDALEKGKEYQPNDNEILTMLLQAYVESNRIKEAITTFQIAVKNEPGKKQNHYLLGVLYRSDLNYDAAIASFQEAVKLDEKYADALFELGATYYNWGVEILRAAQDKGEDPPPAYKEKFKMALPFLEKMTELRPLDIQVWETLGTIYARLGQSDKAMKALDEADKIRKGTK